MITAHAFPPGSTLVADRFNTRNYLHALDLQMQMLHLQNEWYTCNSPGARFASVSKPM
jgi:hypothetical protein